TQENEALDTSLRRLPRQIDRGVDVDGTKGGKRVGRCVVHEMDPRRQMHDRFDAVKRARPIRLAIEAAYGQKSRPRAAADRPMGHLSPRKLGTKRLPDKTRRARYQDHASATSSSAQVYTRVMLCTFPPQGTSPTKFASRAIVNKSMI